MPHRRKLKSRDNKKNVIDDRKLTVDDRERVPDDESIPATVTLARSKSSGAQAQSQKRQDGRFLILLSRTMPWPVDLLRIVDDYATTEPTVSIENLDTDSVYRIDIYTAGEVSGASKAGGASDALQPLVETRFGIMERMDIDRQNGRFFLPNTSSHPDQCSFSFLEYRRGTSSASTGELRYLRYFTYVSVTAVFTRVGSIKPRKNDTGFLVVNQVPVWSGKVVRIHYYSRDGIECEMSNHSILGGPTYYWTGSPSWITNPYGGFGQMLFFVKADWERHYNHYHLFCRSSLFCTHTEVKFAHQNPCCKWLWTMN